MSLQACRRRSGTSGSGGNCAGRLPVLRPHLALACRRPGTSRSGTSRLPRPEPSPLNEGPPPTCRGGRLNEAPTTTLLRIGAVFVGEGAVREVDQHPRCAPMTIATRGIRQLASIPADMLIPPTGNHRRRIALFHAAPRGENSDALAECYACCTATRRRLRFVYSPRTRCKSGWLFRPPIRRTTHTTRIPRIEAADADLVRFLRTP